MKKFGQAWLPSSLKLDEHMLCSTCFSSDGSVDICSHPRLCREMLKISLPHFVPLFSFCLSGWSSVEELDMSVPVNSMVINPWLNIRTTHQGSVYKIAIFKSHNKLIKSELVSGRAWRMVVFSISLSNYLVEPRMGTTSVGGINEWGGIVSVH